MIQEEVFFRNSNGDELIGILRIPDDEGKFPAVILCHDFKSNKDHELMFSLANELSYNRFATLRFDFVGHGGSSGKFKESTLSKMISDIEAAVEFLESLKNVDKDKIALLGHSFGAAACLLTAAGDKRIKAVLCLSCPKDSFEFIGSFVTDHEMHEWEKKGILVMHDFSELSDGFLHDTKLHNLLDAAGRIKAPVAFFHAKDDKRVPFESSRELFNKAIEPKDIDIIEDEDHFYTIKRKYLLDRVVEWLMKNLP